MWVSYHYAVEAFKRQTPRVVVLEGFGLCYGTTYMTPADVDGTSDDYSLRIPPSLNRAALAVAMSRCQQSSPPFYRYLPMLRITVCPTSAATRPTRRGTRRQGWSTGTHRI